MAITHITVAAPTLIDRADWSADHLDENSVVSYGADPTGVADSTSAIQDCIDAVTAAGGGEVFIPAGTYRMDTYCTVPYDLTGSGLRIVGAGHGTVLAPLTGCFIMIGSNSATRTFRNLEFGNFDIDASGVTSTAWGNISCQIGNATVGRQPRCNFEHLYFHDITITDLYEVEAGGTYNQTHGISLNNWITTTSGQHALSTDDIVIERCHVYGGGVGFYIVGDPGSTMTADFDIDNIVVRDCSNISPSVPNAFRTQSNIHIGSQARVWKVRIDNFYGENSGDDGIEVNQPMDLIATNCVIRNAWLSSYVTRNFHEHETDILRKRQRTVYQNCKAIRDSISAYNSSYVKGWAFGGGGSATNDVYGEVLLDHCEYYDNYRLHNFFYSETVTGLCSFESLVIRDCIAHYNLGQNAWTLTGNLSTLWVLDHNENRAGGMDTVENFRVLLNGTVGGAYNISPKILRLNGSDCHWTVRNLAVEWNISMPTGNATPIMIQVNSPGTGKVGMNVDGCKVFQIAGSTGTLDYWSEGANTFDSTHVLYATSNNFTCS